MTEQYATVESRRGTLVVASYSKTEPGFWVMNGFYEILDGSQADDENMARALDRALAKSEVGVPVPDWSSLPIAPILDDLGIKSYATYLKGTKQVGVRKGDCLTLTPTLNAGARDGFTELLDRAVSLPSSAVLAEIGEAVRSCLAVST